MDSLSAGNNSNYPPLSQLIFTISGFMSGKSILGSVIYIRLFIIAADFGIFYFGRKLLKNLNLSENRIFWYLLNPFIIIELTGNLHFEGIMIFFLVWSLYLLQKNQSIKSAVILALSVAVKLIPLLFLPIFFRNLRLKRAISYYGITALTTIFLFLPFFSPAFFENYIATTALWFEKFEFNTSFYYLIRWFGFQLVDFNIIWYSGKILATIILFSVLYLSCSRENKDMRFLIKNMLFAISIYYFLSTTVHPWYLALPLFLSIFTRYRFVMVWTFMVVLSYSAYSNPEFQEKYWLIALEYIVVLGFFFWEIVLKKNKITKEID